VKQLNGTWDKGQGTREGLTHRQIVRSANRQVGNLDNELRRDET
jgi:hypothetical protein